MATLAELPEYMTAGEVAQVVRKTEATLAQDRFLRRGLPYIKIGGRKGGRILYARADVLAYLAAGRQDPSVAS